MEENLKDMENEQEDQVRNVIKDTQMLIRKSMLKHKKFAKELHTNIKKDKKTVDLYKEKIAKLSIEKENLENIDSAKNPNAKEDNLEIEKLKEQIMLQVNEKKDFEDKILEIKEEFNVIKLDMGGLNASKQHQESYEKHIKILENRLDKANQKFNEAIEYDKKLREEIDKLRKERFIFENIYKNLEKDLEKVRKKISENLESAYHNYEVRDTNQENFENLRAQMIKKESEYAQHLSGLANELNIKNSRLKSLEAKDALPKQVKLEDDLGYKSNIKRIKSAQMDTQSENLQEKFQSLQYKFQKLEEFTEQKTVDDFCKKFKTNAQKNFDLFLTISMISKQAKQLEYEIKELEDEIITIREQKSGQIGVEKNTLLNELKTKTQRLIQKQDKFESQYRKKADDFKEIKTKIHNLFLNLECNKDASSYNKLVMEGGIDESNVKTFLSEIEAKLKAMNNFFKMEKEDRFEVKPSEIKIGEKPNPKNIYDNMKTAFANMETTKIPKVFEHIKNSHKPDEIKFEDIEEYSLKVSEEILEFVKRQNIKEKSHNKFKKDKNK